MANKKKKINKKKKQTTKTKQNKLIIIIFIIINFVAAFQAGVVGVFFNEIMRYLVGDFSIIIYIYIMILLIMIFFKKEDLFFKTRLGIAFNMLFITLFIMIGLNYYINLNAYHFSFANQFLNIKSENYLDGAGLIGYIFIFNSIKLIGYLGVKLVIVISFMIILWLVIDFNKLRMNILNIEIPDVKEKSKKELKVTTKKDIDIVEQKEEKQDIVPNNKKYNFFKQKKEKEKEDIVETNNPQDLSGFFKEDPLINNQEENIINNKSNIKKEVDFKHLNKKTEQITKKEVEIETKEISNNDEIPIFMEDSLDKIKQFEHKNVNIDNINYKIPSINMLKEYGNNSKQLEKMRINATQKATVLKETLSSFGLNVEILNIHIGPNVTKYELQPEMGIKVSKFQSLSNDIAMALASNGVRIEAPIPGKAAVGIEIANDITIMVSLREVLESKNNDMENVLQIGLGKDISGSAIFTDITKTPHLLIAGSTGSGKSVCVNSIIISILTKASPNDVKLIMIDPKKVELTPYNGIPHLLTPVVTEPKKAALILNKMVLEMEYRYELFAQTNARNIISYNQKVLKDKTNSYKKLPYIVIIVDELADLMMVASNDVESSIARLAQMARAAGIHLIIATQRPSTDVITGLIKANIPSRISFAVSSSIDSRTILDSSGAEKLLGRGDMLYSEQGSNNLHRIQGAFLSDQEIEDVVENIINQFPKDFVEDKYDINLSNLDVVDSNNEVDELYDEILAEIIRTQRASTSFIQRKYKVGYNRAATIIDQLEANGIISENEGTKPRHVLVGEEYENIKK